MVVVYPLKRLRELPPSILLVTVVILSAFPFIIIGLMPSLLQQTLDTNSYLSFHIIVEIFSIIVSFSIFGVGYYTYNQSQNKYALFLSCAFLAIGLIDLFHVLSFPNMPNFITINDSNKSILFWIAARLISAVALIISAFIYANSKNHWLSKKYLMPATLLISALVFIVVIYFPLYLPSMIIVGSGLTPLKIFSEYIIIGLFAVAFLLYWKRFKKTGNIYIILILAAIILCIFSELSFTLYLSAFDTYNMLGHIYKIIAFLLIYWGIFIVTILEPYHKLEVEIKEREKAEEHIRMLANVVESSDDAIITKSLNGTIISWNKGAEAIYGYSAGEIIGKNISILAPSDLKKEIPMLIDKIKQGEKIQHYETLRLKKDKTAINVSITISPVFDSSGKLVDISIIARDITQEKKAENKIKRALNEKELLLREIHHRVKNNMQIILSLLNLQTQYVVTDEAVEILQEAQDRVKAMSTIHENLYQSTDLTTINFAEYIHSLVKGIFFSHKIKEGQIESIIEIEDIMLNIETAVPCGLIISELVSNSLKHAFPNGQKGNIHLSLKSQEGLFHLNIKDDGIGFPEDLDFKNANSLGLQLVNNLIRQIDGNIQMNKNKGTEIKITFKELEYNERM